MTDIKPNEQRVIIPLSAPEVEVIEKKAYAKYLEKIGKRPTMKDIKSQMMNAHRLHLIHYFGLVLAILMFLVTLVKIWEHQSLIVSVSYTHWRAELLEVNPNLDGFVPEQHHTIMLYQLAFSLASEIALILFLVWYQITPKHAAKSFVTWRDRKFPAEFEWYAQYFPLAMSFLATAYILHVNFASGGFWITNLIPPLVTFTVSKIFEDAFVTNLKATESFRSTLFQKQQEWDDKKRNYETSEVYLEILFVELQEGIVHVRRKDPRQRNRPYEPNLWLRDADQTILLKAVAEQRNRMTQIKLASRREVKRLANGGYEEQQLTIMPKQHKPAIIEPAQDEPQQQPLPEIEYPLPHNGNGNGHQPAAPIAVPAERIKPPAGHDDWTPQALAFAMRSNGHSNLTIQQTQKLYEKVSRSKQGHPNFWNDVLGLLGRSALN
jgi:hypothetical protein